MDTAENDARALIRFYLEAGVDAVLGEEPVDRFAEELPKPGATSSIFPAPAIGDLHGETAVISPERAAARLPRPEPRVPAENTARLSAAPPPAPDIAVMAAREAAKSAASLDQLRTLLESFTGCALSATATQLVFADGQPQARVMFVGEAPGYEEDISGRPFVGRSGKLLDRMMQAIGLDRTCAYVANVVPWRPPGNRTPTPQETAICLPFIRRQIELANPDILVCLGQPATQTLLGTREGITKTRGRWLKFDAGSRPIRAIATFHPAFLLRSPLQKRFGWRDFLAIKKALAATAPDA